MFQRPRGWHPCRKKQKLNIPQRQFNLSARLRSADIHMHRWEKGNSPLGVEFLKSKFGPQKSYSSRLRKPSTFLVWPWFESFVKMWFCPLRSSIMFELDILLVLPSMHDFQSSQLGTFFQFVFSWTGQRKEFMVTTFFSSCFSLRCGQTTKLWLFHSQHLSKK